MPTVNIGGFMFPVERTINFEDIRTRDVILHRTNSASWHIGVVARQEIDCENHQRYLVDTSGLEICNEGWKMDPIYLLHRPPLKLPTEIGTVIKYWDGIKVEVARRIAKDHWRVEGHETSLSDDEILERCAENGYKRAE